VPALSLALLFTIALGVGSNASVYGFVQGLTQPSSLLRGADRIVSIFRQGHHREVGPLSGNEYLLLKNRLDVFDWIGAARITPSDIMMSDHSEIAIVAAVTPNLAGVLDLPLGVGVVISHHMWQSEFGGRANIVGGQIRVNNTDFRITGIATEIIGVVGSQVFGTFQQHAEPAIYFPMWQERPPRMTLILKTSKWNGRLLADLRHRIESVPGQLTSPSDSKGSILANSP
jgi:hypothetical protein